MTVTLLDAIDILHFIVATLLGGLAGLLLYQFVDEHGGWRVKLGLVTVVLFVLGWDVYR